MNNIFNIKRFGLVFRKDFMENLKRYALLFLTMLGIMAIISIFISYGYCQPYEKSGRYSSEIHNVTLLGFMSFAFLAGGLLFASTFMTPMNSKLKRISFLVSPSSNFEKFFSRWIIVTIGYVLSFFVALWIADALRVAVITAYYPDLEIKFLDLTKLVYPKDVHSSVESLMPKTAFTLCVFMYFLFQSLFLLGATFWEKASFIKTFVAISVIVFAYIIVCRWAILLSYEEGLNGFGRVLNSFVDGNNQDMEKQSLMLIKTILPVFTLTNWILAFFRFRESEIIKRF